MDANAIKELASRLTLREKCSLCSGLDMWRTKPVERLGIPSVMMSDGPHGLRTQKKGGDLAGINSSLPATCFPSGVGLAASWDRDLIERTARLIAEEAKSVGVSIVLGPAVNIKRSPLCGRNFEYLSEDPHLAGEMARHHIRGLQSLGVGASIKHFAANNQEKERMTVDTIVDERTLREIYLPAFETAVRESQPWTVMCSYNRINGEYASQNPWLLRKVLKEEWGHEGIVVTDWGACDDRVAGLAAGQELEMPGNGGLGDAEIEKAVLSGALDVAVLDAAVERLLTLVFRGAENLDPAATYDGDAHHATAREIAAECMVLLKNDGVLPLAKKGRIAAIGAFARKPRYQGGGSSHIAPTRIDDAVEELAALAGASAEISYARGYDPASDTPDQALIREAVACAASADVAILFIGLTDDYESEGFDRKHLGIPASHTALLDAVSRVQEDIVVVLSNGSPVEMPWLGKARAVLESYLGGQAWGGAVADILFGVANPSGRLAETFPARIQDNPSYLNFPGTPRRVEYREGIFVGYRHYDALELEPLFPFGHGLSYTRFEYSGLAVPKDRIDASGSDFEVEVSVDVKNVGPVAGREVVQLYVGHPDSVMGRAPKELKGFEKVLLAPGESATVRFRLGLRAFAYWDGVSGGWALENGLVELMVGASSRDLRLRDSVRIVGAPVRTRKFDMNSMLSEVAADPRGAAAVAELGSGFRSALGLTGSAHPGLDKMFDAMVGELPLRNFVRMTGGKVPEARMRELVDRLNEGG